MRTWTWGWGAALAVLLTGILGCGGDAPVSKKETDPAYRIEVEQVRFDRRGVFPFQFLIGTAFIQSEKPIPTNYTWYPDPKATALRVFEDGIERDVLTLKTFESYGKRPNLLVLVMVSKGLMVGPGGGTDVHPKLKEALKVLVEKGIKDTKLFNLAVVFCWGKVERRYPITSSDAADQYLVDMDNLLYPGDPEGSYMSCVEPNLADLDWLQRADPDKADEATRKFGTLPMFIKDEDVDSRNWRTNVVLLTDGEPFREGSLDVMTDLIVKGNFGLYTLGIPASPEGEKGLYRLQGLYERKKMGGNFLMLAGHEELPKTLMQTIDRWLNRGHAFVVEYLSGFSGKRGTTIPLWAAWKDGQYTSRQINVAPATYNLPLHYGLMAFVILLIIGLFIYLLYHFRIWPFRERVRVVACPEGCGHLIPEDWPVCKFCELKGVWGRLIVLNGDRAGKVYYLKNDYYSLGSGEDDDIVLTNLPDLPVQPGHGSVHWVQQGQKIVLKADNGPLAVGSRPVTGPAVNLRFGDILEVGEGGVAAVLLRGVGRTF